MRFVALFLFFVFFCALASRQAIESHQDGFESHMTRIAQKGWRQFSRANAEDRLNIILAVRQQNLQALEDNLLAVSTPSSPRYGQHLTNDEAHALVAPTDESVNTVMNWLLEHNIEGHAITSNSDFIQASITVSQAEALLNTTYHLYQHESGSTVTRVSTPYSVPEDIASHLDFVTPTMVFPPLHNRPKQRKSDPNGFVVTPAFLRELYRLEKTDVGKGLDANNSVAVASFLEQYVDPKDLVAFWKKYPPVVPTMYTYNPTTQPHSPPGDESSLDVQYLPACGAGITSQHWYTAGRQPGNAENEPFVAWLTNVASTPNEDVPDLFSISYGDEEHGVTESYAVRCNTEFQSAGVRGITLLAASGDSGAGCALGAYVPTFPASSPYITGVGGLTGGSAGRHPTGESVAEFSGGGFSNYFSRPSFQDTAVAAYLKQSNVPSTRLFNKDGAGFPDISAQAVQFDVVTDNFFFPLDGTSCACPTAAGLFGLLNQDRLEAGKSKLGFLNPMLYAGAAGGFNDIDSGYNDYCGNPSGFPATKGWDAVTGFGSPDYPSLKAYVTSLP